MSTDKDEEKKRQSRRNFLKGAGAGAIVGAVAVAGIEEGIRLPGMQLIGNTTTVTSTVGLGAVTVSLTATPSAIQAGSSVALAATPSGGTAPYTVSISCGDGSTLTANGSHTYAAAGNYTALVTVTDSKGAKGYATAFIAVSGLAGASTTVSLNVNGHLYSVPVLPNRTLQDVLHDQMGFTSVKSMCTGKGGCGSCAVIVDGRAILSCLALAVALDASAGHKIQTAEGIAASGHPITQSWADMDAMQCGYCSPGAVVSAKALLDSNPSPTRDQVMQALAGNLCVCGTYQYWPNAVLDAAKKLKGGS
jgi:carbon-monoxide dehydrogenase small subunit